ncbi:MAG: hypothetical protein ACQEQT_00360 [Chloroflexota bacterium]
MKIRRYGILVVALIAAFLIGCGGGEEMAAETPEASAPTAVSATDTAVPATDTPIPPTETPPPPTDTPVPPTATPEATATSSPSSEGIASETSGPCHNPFYPIRTDTTWTYRMRGEGAPTDEHSITFTDVSEDTFTTEMIFSDTTVEVRWVCSEEGLVSTEFTNFDLPQMSDFQLETIDFEGTSLPPAGEWEVDTTWDSSYTVKGDIQAQDMTVEATMDVNLQNRIAAVEEVTVPAGTYPQAYRVDSTGKTTMETSGMGTEFDINYSNWYVENVGLVKTSSESEDGTYVTELVAIE